MTYTKLATQPPQRDPTLPYDAVAPGLYPDETAVTLDDGTLVAVSVERHWLSNGGGIAFHGYGRWINADGSTELAPNGAHVEATHAFTADPLTLQAFGEDDIATEVALLVLGEQPKLLKSVPQESGPSTVQPVLDVSDEARLNASIRHQVKAVTATRSSAINL